MVESISNDVMTVGRTEIEYGCEKPVSIVMSRIRPSPNGYEEEYLHDVKCTCEHIYQHSDVSEFTTLTLEKLHITDISRTETSVMQPGFKITIYPQTPEDWLYNVLHLATDLAQALMKQLDREYCPIYMHDGRLIRLSDDFDPIEDLTQLVDCLGVNYNYS